MTSRSKSSSTSHQMDPTDRAIVARLKGNSRCMDCDQGSPEWASVTLGVLVCLDCSGTHRSLGTHLSFVRSVTMDSWTDAQMAKMKVGGNKACKDFLLRYGVDVASKGPSTIQEKYDCPAAELYRQVLKARVEGCPEPTELPEPRNTKKEQEERANRPMTGFGSGPHPSEKRRKRKKIAMGLGAMGSAVAFATWFGMSKKGKRSSQAQ